MMKNLKIWSIVIVIKSSKRGDFCVDHFKIHSDFQPTGDQPQAIKKLVDGINQGLKEQVLLGVTGSGKTFTMANVIAGVNRPTLVLAHNKTLAAQLCSEFRCIFPENAVEYFVSYFLSYWQNAHFKPFFRDLLMLFRRKKLKKTYAQVTLSGTLFHTVFCVP